jgi:glycosyltransferase involved in cell wall biosynthesis
MVDSPDLSNTDLHLLNQADAVMTCSGFCADIFRRCLDCRVIELPLPVDLSQWRWAQRSPPEVFTWLWHAPYESFVSWIIVAKAWQWGMADLPNVRLLLCSGGDSTGLQLLKIRNVEWVKGPVDADFMDRVDGVVHPSLGDGFPLLVAQAMAAGVTIVAPCATGLDGLVDDTTAYVVPDKERRAFGPAESYAADGKYAVSGCDYRRVAESMRQAMGDHEGTVMKSQRARAVIEGACSLEKFGGKFQEELYGYIKEIRQRQGPQ